MTYFVDQLFSLRFVPHRNLWRISDCFRSYRRCPEILGRHEIFEQANIPWETGYVRRRQCTNTGAPIEC